MIEGYLWEELVITRDNMANAYVKLGQKANKLFTGQAKIVHQMETKKSAGERAEENDGERDDTLVELKRDCYEQLKQIVLATARDIDPEIKVENCQVNNQ